jgi:CDP-diacylglycerol--serine O-phosphatidyltransferase
MATKTKLKGFNRIPVRYLLPNLVTLLALCSGVTAIRLGIEGRYELAVGAVIVAIVLDAVDGRLARMLKGSSRFGAELDSLADFLNFGVAPALLLYMWSLHELRNLGWIACLSLAVCCALRLARFNVMEEDPEAPAFKKNFFTGAPAPAGAGIAMLPMYLSFLGLVDGGRATALVVVPYALVVAWLMVSQVPTWSMKNFGGRVSRDHALLILGLAVLFLAMLTAFTWEMLAGIALLYIVLLPFGMRSYQRQARATQ